MEIHACCSDLVSFFYCSEVEQHERPDALAVQLAKVDVTCMALRELGLRLIAEALFLEHWSTSSWVADQDCLGCCYKPKLPHSDFPMKVVREQLHTAREFEAPQELLPDHTLDASLLSE